MFADDAGGHVYVMEIQSLLKKHEIDKRSTNKTKDKEYNAYRNIQLESNGMFNN